MYENIHNLVVLSRRNQAYRINSDDISFLIVWAGHIQVSVWATESIEILFREAFVAYTIAIAGKGGTGKTTLAGLLVDYLVKQKATPILVVDADANSNLNEVLGVKVDMTLGDLRETIVGSEFQDVNPIPASMSKQDYVSAHFSRTLIEESGYDLIVMGRTQGKGCYCFVNDLLTNQINRYAGSYRYLVVDNEAGMEHISRGTLPSVDLVLLVSDSSRRGIQAAARIKDLVNELALAPRAMKLIVNRAPGDELDPGTVEEIEAHDFDVAGIVPNDSLIYEYDCQGRPTVQLPEDSKARIAFESIMSGIIT
ncbi:MAG: AAA family ATPase [Coriobacteriales bacterium]|jgi:CO dehydrogenase maturation factor|nr:AAA family ATPase [Coriobacteriales bacterium]